jgi:hypothetical protein
MSVLSISVEDECRSTKDTQWWSSFGFFFIFQRLHRARFCLRQNAQSYTLAIHIAKQKAVWQ